MGLRYAPFCFTEQGVTMLSSVLNSKAAIEVNIRIIRVFTRMREVLANHKEILMKFERIEKQILMHGGRLNKQDREMEVVFKALKGLLAQPTEPMRKIGFKHKGEN